MAGLKGLVGGEIMQYTSMLEDSRKEAMDRMIKNANQMGANAITIISIRFNYYCLISQAQFIAFTLNLTRYELVNTYFTSSRFVARRQSMTLDL
mgnify:CR=1 FL=1